MLVVYISCWNIARITVPSRSMVEYTKEQSKQVEIITATVARAELTHLRHVNGKAGDNWYLTGFINGVGNVKITLNGENKYVCPD